MPSPKPVVGVDLGGTNMQIGVVAPDHSVIGQSKKKTKAEEGLDAIVARLVDGVREACADAKIRPGDVAAVGIGAPGAIDPAAGVVKVAPNLKWNNVPLGDIVARAVGVPVVLDNDVNAAAWGENQLGAGNKSREMLAVWVGTGVGGGLVLNGRLYYGHHFSAGEIGHCIAMPANMPGTRSVEHNCSRTAVVDRIVQLIRANRASIVPALVDGDLSKVKSKTVAEAYAKGDPLTSEVVDQAADLLGVAVANAITLLSLHRVVLGGGLTEALGRAFVARVSESARRFVFPEELRKVEIVATKLEDLAGVLGAALLAREKLNA